MKPQRPKCPYDMDAVTDWRRVSIYKAGDRKAVKQRLNRRFRRSAKPIRPESP